MLDTLLLDMENRRGKLVVVFAGYQKQMEELLAHNEGLPSRFAQVLCSLAWLGSSGPPPPTRGGGQRVGMQSLRPPTLQPL